MLLEATLWGLPQPYFSVAMGQGSPGIGTSRRTAAGRGHMGEEGVSSVRALSNRLGRAAHAVPAPTWSPQGTHSCCAPCQSWQSASLPHCPAPPGLSRGLPTFNLLSLEPGQPGNFSQKECSPFRKGSVSHPGAEVLWRSQSWWQWVWRGGKDSFLQAGWTPSWLHSIPGILTVGGMG